METWEKHEIRPHQGAGPALDPLPTEPLPAPDNSGADSRDVEGYVLRMRRIRDREEGRVVDEPPAPVSIVGTVVTRDEKKEDENMSPSKTPQQARAMQAAAAGKSTLGIPKTVGKEFVKANKAKPAAKPTKKK